MKHHPFYAAVLILACCTQSAAQEQGEKEEGAFKFAVQTQLVEVYVTVTKGKQLIPNLKASDFTLTEDESPVTIDRLDDQEVPLNIVLLVDISQSVQDTLGTIQDAAIAFVNSLHQQDRVTLIFFNSGIVAYQQLTDDRKPIIQQIKSAKAGGMTKLYESMILGMKQLEGKTGRKAIVCFTDGENTSGTSSRADVLNSAARSGYPIYTMGAGAGLELSTLKIILKEFADINGGRAFFIENLGRLRNAFEEAAAELRSAYVLHYYTRIPQDGRWHDLSIQTTDPQYTVHSRKGFFAQLAADPKKQNSGTSVP
jgi:VWFA-related protein